VPNQLKDLADQHQLKYFITSAKTGAGISELLGSIAGQSVAFRQFDVVFIGHCTKDEITIKGTTSYLPGGGVYFGAMSAGWALKRFPSSDSRMRVLTVGNPIDYLTIHSEVTKCGCSLQVLGSDSTTTFLHSFRDDNPDQRVSSVGAVGRSFAWSDIESIRAKLFYVNPLFFGEVDPKLFRVMKQNCDLLFVDAQGLIRRRDGQKIYHERPADLRETVVGVDILKVDAEEATSLTGIENTEEACAELMKLGLKYLICTQKAGVAVYGEGTRTWAEFGKWTLEGRTGRGDTVSAAFLVLHFVAGMEIGQALRYAAEGCSNKMMHPGAAVEADFAQIAQA
jgi:sugar/nucleoside kinase (ribokinase family)